MNIMLLVYLMSVAMATVSRRAILNCDLRSGDKVVAKGTLINRTGKTGMALLMYSGEGLRRSIRWRVEVFIRPNVVHLRSKTQTQDLPQLVKSTTYDGGNDVEIEVTVDANGNYNINVNGIHRGAIRNIGGPVPRVIETAYDFQTERLDVYSDCAANPATTAATTLSPAVRIATENVNKAATELLNAINAKARLDATAANMSNAYITAKSKAASKTLLNAQARTSMLDLVNAVSDARTVVERALAAAEDSRDAAQGAAAQAILAKNAAVDAARVAATPENIAARDQAIAAEAKASAAALKAVNDCRMIEVASVAAIAQEMNAQTARDFFLNSARVSEEEANKVADVAQKAAFDAAAAAEAGKLEVEAKTKVKNDAEAALYAARG